MIQTRIGKGKKSDPPNRTKLFAKLVMEGFLNDDACGGVLPLTEEKQQRRSSESSPSGVDANGSREYFPANRLSNLAQRFVTLCQL